MKKFWKRIVSCVLIGCMLTSAVAFAANTEEDSATDTTTEVTDSSTPELELAEPVVAITYYNEIEEVLRMREATAEELEAMDISEEEAEEIASLDIEQAYYERAQLPEDQLRAYGYTDEQIAILKDYDGSTITSDSAVVLASATCTGSASKVSASTSKIAFKYTWTWSSAPVFMRTDKVAIKWQAYNSSSSAIDVDNSQSTTVSYYWLSSGSYNTAKYPTTSTSSSFSGCSANVVMQYSKENNGNTDSIWAKKGSTTVTLSKSGSSISYIKFTGSYGHAVVTISGGISLSVTGLSISFSPANSVNKLATVTKKLTSSGTLSSI